MLAGLVLVKHEYQFLFAMGQLMPWSRGDLEPYKSHENRVLCLHLVL